MVSIMGFIIIPTVPAKSDISDYYPYVRNSDKVELKGFSKVLLTSTTTPRPALSIPT